MNTFIQLSPDERNLYCRQAAERMEIPLPAAVIYKVIPSFEELLSFAEQFENEFNEWVKKS
jgi:hypothetical protein